MATPADPSREHPSTYFVQDRSNKEELPRVTNQDQMLREQPDPTLFQRVLDVGCGTGDWLIEVAKTYPRMTLLVGVDVSSKMIEHAQVQAEAQQVSDRVQFRTMDGLRMLGFPTNFFDLINQRFATSCLRTWDQPKLLQECERISRPDGVIRVAEMITETSSLAHQRLLDLMLEVLYRAGHFFSPNQNGVTSQLARLLRQTGFQNV